jgi:hypothetical protein
MVSPDFMSDIYAWRNAFYRLSDSMDKDGKVLFQSFVMRCSDPSLGCVLFAGFEHSLGDAASYALFLSRWSEIYGSLESQSGANPAADLPNAIFATPVTSVENVLEPTGRPSPRRYELSPEMLSAFKADMRRQSGEPNLSVNDILVAQV